MEDFNVKFNKSAFDLVYNSLRKELDYQKELEREMNKEIKDIRMYNINVFEIQELMEQLKEQDAIYYLTAEVIYDRTYKKES